MPEMEWSKGIWNYVGNLIPGASRSQEDVDGDEEEVFEDVPDEEEIIKEFKKKNKNRKLKDAKMERKTELRGHGKENSADRLGDEIEVITDIIPGDEIDMSSITKGDSDDESEADDQSESDEDEENENDDDEEDGDTDGTSSDEESADEGGEYEEEGGDKDPSSSSSSSEYEDSEDVDTEIENNTSESTGCTTMSNGSERNTKQIDGNERTTKQIDNRERNKQEIDHTSPETSDVKCPSELNTSDQQLQDHHHNENKHDDDCEQRDKEEQTKKSNIQTNQIEEDDVDAVEVDIGTDETNSEELSRHLRKMLKKTETKTGDYENPDDGCKGSGKNNDDDDDNDDGKDDERIIKTKVKDETPKEEMDESGDEMDEMMKESEADGLAVHSEKDENKEDHHVKGGNKKNVHPKEQKKKNTDSKEENAASMDENKKKGESMVRNKKKADCKDDSSDENKRGDDSIVENKKQTDSKDQDMKFSEIGNKKNTNSNQENSESSDSKSETTASFDSHDENKKNNDKEENKDDGASKKENKKSTDSKSVANGFDDDNLQLEISNTKDNKINGDGNKNKSNKNKSKIKPDKSKTDKRTNNHPDVSSVTESESKEIQEYTDEMKEEKLNNNEGLKTDNGNENQEKENVNKNDENDSQDKENENKDDKKLTQKKGGGEKQKSYFEGEEFERRSALATMMDKGILEMEILTHPTNTLQFSDIAKKILKEVQDSRTEKECRSPKTKNKNMKMKQIAEEDKKSLDQDECIAVLNQPDDLEPKGNNTDDDLKPKGNKTEKEDQDLAIQEETHEGLNPCTKTLSVPKPLESDCILEMLDKPKTRKPSVTFKTGDDSIIETSKKSGKNSKGDPQTPDGMPLTPSPSVSDCSFPSISPTDPPPGSVSLTEVSTSLQSPSVKPPPSEDSCPDRVPPPPKPLENSLSSSSPPIMSSSSCSVSEISAHHPPPLNTTSGTSSLSTPVDTSTTPGDTCSPPDTSSTTFSTSTPSSSSPLTSTLSTPLDTSSLPNKEDLSLTLSTPKDSSLPLSSPGDTSISSASPPQDASPPTSEPFLSVPSPQTNALSSLLTPPETSPPPLTLLENTPVTPWPSGKNSPPFTSIENSKQLLHLENSTSSQEKNIFVKTSNTKASSPPTPPLKISSAPNSPLKTTSSNPSPIKKTPEIKSCSQPSSPLEKLQPLVSPLQKVKSLPKSPSSVISLVTEEQGGGSIKPSTMAAAETLEPDTCDPKKVGAAGERSYQCFTDTGRGRVLHERSGDSIACTCEENQQTGSERVLGAQDTNGNITGVVEKEKRSGSDVISGDSDVETKDAKKGLFTKSSKDFDGKSETSVATGDSSYTLLSNETSETETNCDIIGGGDVTVDSTGEIYDVSKHTGPSTKTDASTTLEVLENEANENKEIGNNGERGKGKKDIGRDNNDSLDVKDIEKNKVKDQNSLEDESDPDNLEGPWSSPQLAKVVQELVVCKKFKMTTAQVKKRQHNISRLDIPIKDRTVIFDSTKLSSKGKTDYDSMSDRGCIESKKKSESQENLLKGVTKKLNASTNRNKKFLSVDKDKNSDVDVSISEANNQLPKDGNNTPTEGEKVHMKNPKNEGRRLLPHKGKLFGRGHSDLNKSKNETSKLKGKPKEESKTLPSPRIERLCHSPQFHKNKNFGGHRDNQASQLSPRQSPVRLRRQSSPKRPTQSESYRGSSSSIGHSPALNSSRRNSPKMGLKSSKSVSPKSSPQSGPPRIPSPKSPKKSRSPKLSKKSSSPRFISAKIVKPVGSQEKARTSPKNSPVPSPKRTDNVLGKQKTGKHDGKKSKSYNRGSRNNSISSVKDTEEVERKEKNPDTEDDNNSCLLSETEAILKENNGKDKNVESVDNEGKSNGSEVVGKENIKTFDEQDKDVAENDTENLENLKDIQKIDSSKTESPEGIAVSGISSVESPQKINVPGEPITPTKPYKAMHKEISDCKQHLDSFIDSKFLQDQHQQRFVYIASKMSGKLDSEILQFFENQQQKPREILRNEKLIQEHFKGNPKTEKRSKFLENALEKVCDTDSDTKDSQITECEANDESLSIDLKEKCDSKEQGESVCELEEGSSKNKGHCQMVSPKSDIGNSDKELSKTGEPPASSEVKNKLKVSKNTAHIGDANIQGNDENSNEDKINQKTSDRNEKNKRSKDGSGRKEKAEKAHKIINSNEKGSNINEIKNTVSGKEEKKDSEQCLDEDETKVSVRKRDELIARFRQDDAIMIEKIRSIKGSINEKSLELKNDVNEGPESTVSEGKVLPSKVLDKEESLDDLEKIALIDDLLDDALIDEDFEDSLRDKNSQLKVNKEGERSGVLHQNEIKKINLQCSATGKETAMVSQINLTSVLASADDLPGGKEGQTVLDGSLKKEKEILSENQTCKKNNSLDKNADHRRSDFGAPEGEVVEAITENSQKGNTDQSDTALVIKQADNPKQEVHGVHCTLFSADNISKIRGNISTTNDETHATEFGIPRVISTTHLELSKSDELQKKGSSIDLKPTVSTEIIHVNANYERSSDITANTQESKESEKSFTELRFSRADGDQCSSKQEPEVTYVNVPPKTNRLTSSGNEIKIENIRFGGDPDRKRSPGQKENKVTRKLMPSHRRLTKTISDGNFRLANDSTSAADASNDVKTSRPPSFKRSQTESEFNKVKLQAAESDVSKTSSVSEIFARGVSGKIRAKSRSVENIRLSSLSCVEITNPIDTPPITKSNSSCRIVGVLKKKDSRENVLDLMSSPQDKDLNSEDIDRKSVAKKDIVKSSIPTNKSSDTDSLKSHRSLSKQNSLVRTATEHIESTVLEQAQPLECTITGTIKPVEMQQGKLHITGSSTTETHIYENVPEVYKAGIIEIPSHGDSEHSKINILDEKPKNLVAKVVHIYENLPTPLQLVEPPVGKLKEVVSPKVTDTTAAGNIASSGILKTQTVQELNTFNRENARMEALSQSEKVDLKELSRSSLVSVRPPKMPSEPSSPKRSTFEKSSLRRRQQPESESRVEKQKSNYMRQRSVRVGILKKQKSDITGVRLQKLHYFDTELPGERRRSYSIGAEPGKNSNSPKKEGSDERESDSQENSQGPETSKLEISEFERRCHSSISTSSNSSRSSAIDKILQSCAPCISSNTGSTLDLTVRSAVHPLSGESDTDSSNKGQLPDDSLFNESDSIKNHGVMPQASSSKSTFGTSSSSSWSSDANSEMPSCAQVKQNEEDVTVRSGHSTNTVPSSKDSKSSTREGNSNRDMNFAKPSKVNIETRQVVLLENEDNANVLVNAEKDGSTSTLQQVEGGDTDFYSDLLDTILSVVDGQDQSNAESSKVPTLKTDQPVATDTSLPSPKKYNISESQDIIKSKCTPETVVVQLQLERPVPLSPKKEEPERRPGTSDSDSTASVDSELAEVRRRITERFPPAPREDSQASEESVLVSPSAVCPMPNCAACRSHGSNSSQPLVFNFEQPLTPTCCEPPRAASLSFVDQVCEEEKNHEVFSRSTSLPYDADVYQTTELVNKNDQDDDEYLSATSDDTGRHTPQMLSLPQSFSSQIEVKLEDVNQISAEDRPSQSSPEHTSLKITSPEDKCSQDDAVPVSIKDAFKDHSESSSNQLAEEMSSLRLENEKLSARNRSLQREVEELRRVKESMVEEDLQLKPQINQMTMELTHAKEALSALKADRKRLKAEKFDLLNQMKQLYATLEDKEKELRDFIRNYEQRMKESDESLRHLAAERDETEREKWNILKHARDESEKVVKLSAQLGVKEAAIRKLQDDLEMVRKQLTSVGYYSDAESVRTNGLPTPTASTPTCSPQPVSTPTPTPNGRGSSADSGVRLSSDRDSTASHDGGVGTPKESPSLSPLYATPSCMKGDDRGGEITPTGGPTPTGTSLNSSAMSGLASSNASSGGLSRSAEQLCERLAEAGDASKTRGSNTLSRKSNKSGGTWGSISRVFARQKKRAALDASLYDGNASDKRASWSPSSSLCVSPLTEESYSEKLRLLEEAQHIPLERWKAPTVLAWLEVTLGMPQYGAMCAENVRSGKVLLELSDSELEVGLGISHPMHRKKLRLAIEELREPRLSRFPRISALGHIWVSSEWLPDLGLPHYCDAFANNLVDGRLLEALTKKELEKHLGVHRKFHQASIIHGVHLLRIVRFDRGILAERRRQCENVDCDPIVWTNVRWVRWARSIDLAEYADNLKDSGVHGALVVLESSFTSDTMATALGIPQSKNIIRRHLATELESLVNPARQQLDEQARFAKLERRRQEKLAAGGSLGRSFSRSYGTGLEKSDKDKRRASLRGSLSRALGLRVRDEMNAAANGGESSSSGGQSPAVSSRAHPHHPPQARPRSSVMPSGVYVHHETHRRVKSIGDIETITVTPV